MSHGKNNPTGSLGFSPTWITLFAPVAFLVEGWLLAIGIFSGVMLLLFVRGWFEHQADLRRWKREKETRSW